MFRADRVQTRNPADAGLLGPVDVKCPSLKDGHLARPSHVLRQVHLDAHLNRVRQDILGTIRKSNKALKGHIDATELLLPPFTPGIIV
jgi:hypothetical protein